MTNQEIYYSYLKKRSRIGDVYRKYFLYPKIDSVIIGRALDYGCGLGDFLKFRANTVGVDINRFAIDHCLSRNLDAKLLGESYRIPYDDGHFFSVVADNVIEHITAQEVDAVIEEIQRVLKKGGIVVAGVPGIKGHLYDTDHKVFYGEKHLVELFTKHGFTLKHIFRMPLPFQSLSKYLRQYCIYAVFSH